MERKREKGKGKGRKKKEREGKESEIVNEREEKERERKVRKLNKKCRLVKRTEILGRNEKFRERGRLEGKKRAQLPFLAVWLRFPVSQSFKAC